MIFLKYNYFLFLMNVNFNLNGVSFPSILKELQFTSSQTDLGIKCGDI